MEWGMREERRDRANRIIYVLARRAALSSSPYLPHSDALSISVPIVDHPLLVHRGISFHDLAFGDPPNSPSPLSCHVFHAEEETLR